MSNLEDGYISPNFRAAEFTCNHCGEVGTPPPQIVLDWLEAIRAEHDSPVIINSGYRCPTHNSNVGGAQHSCHLEGHAVDFYVKGVDPAYVYVEMDILVGDQGGVGKYNTFTHIDARGSRARW